MRRRKAERRKIEPDVRYNNVKVQTFINHVLKKGKKNVAAMLVYGAFDIMAEKNDECFLANFPPPYSSRRILVSMA